MKQFEGAEDATSQAEKLRFLWQTSSCNLTENIYSALRVKTMNYFTLEDMEHLKREITMVLFILLRSRASHSALTVMLLKLVAKHAHVIQENLLVSYVTLAKRIIMFRALVLDYNALIADIWPRIVEVAPLLNVHNAKTVTFGGLEIVKRI